MSSLRLRKTGAPVVLRVCVAVTIFFVVVPIALTLMAGFVANYPVGIRSGLTTRWIEEVWSVYGDTVARSIALALACLVIVIALGTPCAYALSQVRSRWGRALEELLMMPVAVPGLATALALILMYGHFRGFRASVVFVLVGHVLFTMPFLVRSLIPAFANNELRALDEAARTLGASFMQRFLGVLVPAVLPSLAAGALMVFTLSIGEFNLTWMLHTPLTRTLPVGLADSYASMRLEIGSAYTVIFIAVVVPTLWLLQLGADALQRYFSINR
jgi:putative spermidine/putrescine transport system permease protein